MRSKDGSGQVPATQDVKMRQAGDDTHRETPDQATDSKKKKRGVFVTKEKKTVQGKYVFTEKEKAELADTTCRLQQELIEREDEKKAAMAGYTDKIKTIKLEISRASRKYRDGFELRDYECVLVMDYGARVKKYRDVRTGKTVDQHPFGPGDDQRRFI